MLHVQRHQLGAVDPATFIQSIPGGPIVLAYVKGEVRDAARAAVLPYVLGALAASGVALVISVAAILRR